MANTVCHVEFVAENIGAAGEFYSKVFGWELTPAGEQYVIWSAGKNEIGGGIMPVEAWTVGQRTFAYIKVDDIQAMLSAVNTAGGSTIHPKTKISDEHGFYAVIKDPQGTIVGLWCRT